MASSTSAARRNDKGNACAHDALVAAGPYHVGSQHQGHVASSQEAGYVPDENRVGASPYLAESEGLQREGSVHTESVGGTGPHLVRRRDALAVVAKVMRRVA